MKVLTALFVLLIGLKGISQSANNLKVRAQIKTEKKIRVNQAQVSLRDTMGIVIQTVPLKKNGRFQIEVPLEQFYELWVTCVDHQSKIIRFNTLNVPACDSRFGYDFSGFTINLRAGQMASQPHIVAHVYYEPCIESFSFSAHK